MARIEYFDYAEFRAFLNSLDFEMADLTVQFLSVISENFAVDNNWVKALPGDVLQVRIGNSTSKVYKKLGMAPALAPDRKLLLRLFVADLGMRLLVLGGYDKLANPGSHEQKHQIGLAISRLEAFRQRELPK
ncbi:MAG: hypothetical protein ACKOWJ_01830 [Micrococcales bacterium]